MKKRANGFIPLETKNLWFLTTRKRIGSLTGFTLIELLVVIAIIALLASIILASLMSARAKGRDARRYAEIRQFATAVELYRSNNSTYPNVGNCGAQVPDPNYPNITGWAGASTNSSEYTSCQSTLQNMLAPYIPKLPLDPLNSGPDESGYYYWYASVRNGQGYLVMAFMEVLRDTGEACYYPEYEGGGIYCIGENWE